MNSRYWAEEEKEKYATKKSTDTALRILYAQNQLKADNPQARRDFLYNQLRLGETNEMTPKSKVEELLQLEDLFSEFY